MHTQLRVHFHNDMETDYIRYWEFIIIFTARRIRLGCGDGVGALTMLNRRRRSSETDYREVLERCVFSTLPEGRSDFLYARKLIELLNEVNKRLSSVCAFKL